MPINKNALIRYKILNECFRNTAKSYSLKDLMDAINERFDEIDPRVACISRRQIYLDIHFMESPEGWNIELDEHLHDGKKRIYRYIDPEFSIDNMPMNESQIKYMESVVNTLEGFKGLPQLDWLTDGLTQMKVSVNPTARKFIEFDSNPYLKGSEFLEPIFNAIQYKKVLEVQYQPFDEKQQTFIAHPQYLKQYNKRWYMIALTDHDMNTPYNLALDRIITIKETNKPYDDARIDFSEYFSDVVGMTVYEGQEARKVHLRITKPTANYIASKPIHESQCQKWIDDELDVVLRVKFNRELENVLMSYADSITILEPEDLKAKIKSRLETALRGI